jgi:hypothetical protein
MGIPSTPTLVVAGKYRLNNEAFTSIDQITELVNYLIARDTPAAAAKPAAAPAKPAAAPVKPAKP